MTDITECMLHTQTSLPTTVLQQPLNPCVHVPSVLIAWFKSRMGLDRAVEQVVVSLVMRFESRCPVPSAVHTQTPTHTQTHTHSLFSNMNTHAVCGLAVGILVRGALATTCSLKICKTIYFKVLWIQDRPNSKKQSLTKYFKLD